MTHTTVGSVEKESRGSQIAFVHQINITSLDAAGQENYSPNSELNLPEDAVLQVTPVGKTDENKLFSWNITGTHLNVQQINATATGTAGLEDVANNTACGEVRLLVAGGGT